MFKATFTSQESTKSANFCLCQVKVILETNQMVYNYIILISCANLATSLCLSL